MKIGCEGLFDTLCRHLSQRLPAIHHTGIVDENVQPTGFSLNSINRSTSFVVDSHIKFDRSSISYGYVIRVPCAGIHRRPVVDETVSDLLADSPCCTRNQCDLSL